MSSFAHTEAPSSCKESAQRIMGGGPKCPSVVPFEIPDSEGPFEVASFEHFDWERHFNLVAMIVFTLKCPSEGDISRLEHTAVSVESL